MDKQTRINDLKKENRINKIKSLAIKSASIIATLGLMNLSVWAILRAVVLSSQLLTVIGAIGVTCSPVAILSAGLLIAKKWDNKVEENEKQIEFIKQNLLSEEKNVDNKISYQNVSEVSYNANSKQHTRKNENSQNHNIDEGLTN